MRSVGPLKLGVLYGPVFFRWQIWVYANSMQGFFPDLSLIYIEFCYIYFAGPEMLLRQSSDLQGQEIVNTNFGGDTGDAFEAHEWRYVRTFNGIFNSLYYSSWNFKESYSSSLYLLYYPLQYCGFG